MKASVIVGSRTGGITDSQCEALAEVLECAGWECSLIRPSEMDIADCTGCMSCGSGKGCVMDDDMASVLKEFLDSDAVVLASPVRFSSLSSLLKKAMDRFQPLWNSEEVLGRRRRLVLLMNGGSDTPRTEYAEGCVRAFCISMNCEYMGCWLMSATDRNGFSDHAMEIISDEILRALSS